MLRSPYLRCLFVLFVAPFQAVAAPILNPPVPSISSFANCKNSEVAGFDSYTRCMLPGNLGGIQNLGKPVDGNTQRRHVNWMLDKMQVAGYDETIYKISQVAFDCYANKAVLRDVYTFVQNSDLTRISSPVDLRTWKPADTDLNKTMAIFCPPKEGYVRFGNSQYAIQSAIRKGNRVNVNGLSPTGKEHVIAIDCSTMMFGLDAQPSRPIPPKSVGYNIYKRVCN